jgi:exodeoxyribonuclease-3
MGEGLIDTFRHVYPEEVKYTYWNYVTNARAKNTGWRIDYFLISEKLKPSISNAEIYNQYMGSDHCPVGLKLNL